MSILPKPSTSVRLLCAADLHLGRQLSGLPQELNPGDFSPKVAWNELVNFALNKDNQIDALVLVGDIIDKEEFFFETFLPLESGLRKLIAANIPVIAVAGNHDPLIFKKLKDNIKSEKLHLLGHSEKWESITLTLNNMQIRFDGWSFLQSYYHQNPFDRYHTDLASPQQQLAIGLLHCDLLNSKNSSSPYAPVTISDFQNTPHAAWILGHIHKPEIVLDCPLVVYCGSPQGLDPTETDSHGALILDVSSTSEIHAQKLPLAPLVWMPLTLNVSQLTEEKIETEIIESIIQLHHLISHKEYSSAKVIALRLTFSGRSLLYRKIPQLILNIENKILLSRQTTSGKEILYYVETVINESEPDFDLIQLSQSKDYPGLLAKRLLCLINGDSNFEHMQLINEAKQRLIQMKESSPQFSEIDTVFSDELVKKYLVKKGFEALDQLLMQKGIQK